MNIMLIYRISFPYTVSQNYVVWEEFLFAGVWNYWEAFIQTTLSRQCMENYCMK